MLLGSRGWARSTVRGRWARTFALMAVGLLLAGGFEVGIPGAPAQGAGPATPPPPLAPYASSGFSRLSLDELEHAPRAPVVEAHADLPLPGATVLGPAVSVPLDIFVSLRFENASGLAALLSGLSAPRPTAGGAHFLSAGEFVARFAPSPVDYSATVAYFASFAVAGLTTFPDRSAIYFEALPTVAESIFGMSIERFRSGNLVYAGPSSVPTLPAPLAHLVAGVEGLGNGPAERAGVTVGALEATSVGPSSEGVRADARPMSPLVAGGYPAPVSTPSGTQLIYPTDLQVAYDEESLLSAYGAPVNASVAAILSSGSYLGPNLTTGCGPLTRGESVGPYDPSDFAAFFNQTSPGTQPHPVLRGVNLTGPAGGCLSSWDSTGVTVANTAELEAIGATAPGATIWGVSVADPTLSQLDLALASILSPPATLDPAVQAALRGVDVVEVGWSFNDTTDAAWAASIATAQARGISVVSSSGDSGDDPASSAWVGSNATFPSSSATNVSGTVAVGGTTLRLDPLSLHIADEVAWSDSLPGGSGGPRGSAGGISSVYPEPSWQAGASSDAVLAGAGRGVPDVAAIANNTLVTVSVDGVRYNATNATTSLTDYVAVNGTGVAAGVLAGLLTEIDHVHLLAANGLLGFPDPTLYALGSLEYAPLPAGTSRGGSSYSSPLPTLPFHDIVGGANDRYAAGIGYDLVTGWGSLDAYNFTMYVLRAPVKPLWGRLSGVENSVSLTSLAVVSDYPGGVPPPVPAASVQQSLVVANTLGAPLYSVRNVVTLERNTSSVGKWDVALQASMGLPFWGLYPDLAIYESRNVSLGPRSLPLTLTIETVLVPGSVFLPPMVKVDFGVAGSPVLTFSLPGASYFVGSPNYTYSWQGTNYTNGPGRSGGSGGPGTLAPQIALLGYPNGSTAHFQNHTAGTITDYVQPLGSSNYQLASTGVVTASNKQSEESARNLSYVPGSSGSVLLSDAAGTGASEEGVYETELPRFPVRFTQSGAPKGSTWYVNVTGTRTVQASAPYNLRTIQILLPNGSYTWKCTIDAKGLSAFPRTGSLEMAGAPLNVSLTFGPSLSSVTFTAWAAPHVLLPPSWYVNLSGGPSLHGTTLSVTTQLSLGTYTYHASSDNATWRAASPNASFAVSSLTTVVYVQFTRVTYPVELVFRIPNGSCPQMTVAIGTHVGAGCFTTFTSHLINGTYPWSVTKLPKGLSASPAGGEFHVSGPGPSRSHGRYVTFVTISGPRAAWGPFGLGDAGLVLVGLLIAVPLVLLVVLLRRRRAPLHEEEEYDETFDRSARERPRGPRRSSRPRRNDDFFDEEP